MKRTAILLILMGCAFEPHALALEVQLDVSACNLTLPLTPTVVRAECGSLIVPENPGEPTGRKIGIEFAVLKARVASPAPDPLFFFAGGPGQSAIDVLVQREKLFTEFLKRRDVVFVDQRGTGRSNALTCGFGDVAEAVIEDGDLMKLVRECLQQVKGDPRYYSTKFAVEDFERVRAALGYETINLIGGSYGTRVVQEYLRRYPDKVRSIVLDSVVSPGDILGTEHSLNLTNALGLMVEKCEQRPACDEAFPDLRESLAIYLNMDIREKRIVEFRHPRTGEWQTQEVTREVIDLAIRMYAYDPASLSILPLMLTRAARGEWRELVAGATLVGAQMDGMMSAGMHNSVMCAEDAHHYPVTTTDTDNAILGRITHVINLICSQWPTGAPDMEVHQPLESDVPALLLSGEMDPVTPPRNGERALRQFSNGTHLQAEGLGHFVFSNHCFNKVVAEFVDTLEVPDKAEKCTAHDWSSSFFTSMVGTSSDVGESND